MSISHFLALRYLRTSQENRFFSWITVLSTIGIAIGVAALVVVLSVINGFEHELRKRFLHINAHIMVYRHPAGMAEPEKWMEIIGEDFRSSVKGMAPFIHHESMIRAKSIMQGVIIRGIDPAKQNQVQNLSDIITPRSAQEKLQQEVTLYQNSQQLPTKPGVIIGTGLQRLLNVELGDEVELVSPAADQEELISYQVVGTIDSGLKHYDNRLVVMSLPTAQAFLNYGEVVTGLAIALFDHDLSDKIQTAMEDKYKLTIVNWKNFNRRLFESMEKQKLLIAVIVAMVVVVAAFNILTTVFVSVSQKQKDISILKSLGATNRQIIWLFVNQGLYIGVLGGITGGILALVISRGLELYLPKFMELPDPYFLKTLPIHYSPMVYLSVIVAAMVLCLLAGLYPALIAAKVRPSEGFKGTAGMI